MEEKRTYKGKYFSILGDSISTLAGYNPPECAVFYDRGNQYLSGVFAPEDTWWGRVIDALGGRMLVNNAWAGSLVCRHPSCEIESYGCSDARTRALSTEAHVPDVIMILLGLNDLGWGMRITAGDGEDRRSAFSPAYEIMLEKIKENYPQAEIWCLTLPGGQRGAAYSDAIRDCGKRAGCRVIDLDRFGQPCETMDGYHPTAGGMETIAAAVLECVQAAERKTDTSGPRENLGKLDRKHPSL